MHGRALFMHVPGSELGSCMELWFSCIDLLFMIIDIQSLPFYNRISYFVLQVSSFFHLGILFCNIPY
jgi:hypothetical protein